MASATGISDLTRYLPYAKLLGKDVCIKKATIPSGESSCTVALKHYLTPKSVVFVENLEAGDKKLIEILSGRTYGNKGTVTIGTVDASNVTSDRDFLIFVSTP